MASAVLREEMFRVEWVPVQSSNLEMVGYVPDFGRLWVRFLAKSTKNGGYTPPRVYAYFDVPPGVYDGLLSAGSKGEYHARHVKDVYGYERVL